MFGKLAHIWSFKRTTWLARGTDGIARQTRYEVLFLPPSGGRGTKRFIKCDEPNLTGSNTAREVSLKCDQIESLVEIWTLYQIIIFTTVRSCSWVVFCRYNCNYRQI